MSRLSCITELRDIVAMGVLDTAIEGIRDWQERWGDHTRRTCPEEFAKTQRILGNLLEMQADELLLSVREGEAMHIRQTLEAANDPDGDDTPPSPAMALEVAA